MAIDAAFKFTKIVVIRGARNLKGFPQVKSARRETLKVAVVFASS